jgi:phage/plasmid-like protein (TIGR03299 family)
MSRETDAWLNNYTLVGYTAQRGNAWHYRQHLQGNESNHYEFAIPVDDVNRRLFNFRVEDRPIFIRKASGEYVMVEDRKAMVRDDNDVVLGLFKSGYEGHQYQEWLLENVATILDDDLGIGSAGLLRNGGQAWVSVEVPENITTPEGVDFRPNLLACTSFDGSLATTYKRVITRVVCDNTAEQARSEDGQQFKVRHTKWSGMKIVDAREALHVVHTMTDDFMKEVAALTAWKVTDAEFGKIMELVVPINEDHKKIGITKAEKKRAELVNLWHHDDRVAPWKNTAFGVAQAYNTWQQHFATVRKGVPREVRNMENLVTGKTGNLDRDVLKVLADVVPNDMALAVTA